MANRRMITSAIWDDDWFGPLPYFDQALWIGLFSKCADDQGRLLDNARLIRAALFPYKDTPIKDIEVALDGFSKAGRLYRYKAEGKALLQIRTWWTHQRPQWANYSKWAGPIGWQDHVRTRLDGQYVADNWLNQSGNAEASRKWSPSPDLSPEASPEVQALLLRQRPHLFRQYPDPDPVPDPVPDPDPVVVGGNTTATPPTALSQGTEQKLSPEMRQKLTDTLKRPVLPSDELHWSGLLETYGHDTAEYAVNEAFVCGKEHWAYIDTVAAAEHERQTDQAAATNRRPPSASGSG